MKLLKNLHFVIGYILWCIVCCSSQTGESSTRTSNEEIYLSSTQDSSTNISSEVTSQTELPSTGLSSFQQGYSSMQYTTDSNIVSQSAASLGSTTISPSTISLSPIDSTNLTVATSTSLPSQVSTRDTSIILTILTTGSVSYLQSDVSIGPSSSETSQIAEAEVNTNITDNANTFQTSTISSTLIGSSDSTTIATSTSQTTTIELPATTVVANESTPSSQSTICVISTSSTQANLTETVSITETHSELANISLDYSNETTTLHSTEKGETTVYSTSLNYTITPFSISSQEYTQAFDSEIQRSSHAAINESLPSEQVASNTTTLISVVTEKQETATFDQTVNLNITEVIFTPETYLSSSSPGPMSETSEKIVIEEVAEEMEDERQKKYWTKSDIYLVIGIMFVLNVVNLIIVVFCVLRITKKRQRWERPPMKYGSRILYNNSPQVECIRAVSGRDLASDSECKQGENASESVPVIRIDEGWCVPIEKEGKPKDKTEDTGV